MLTLSQLPKLTHFRTHSSAFTLSIYIYIYISVCGCFFFAVMNARIRAQMDVSNPFRFRYIQNLKSIDVNSFDDTGPSVVFASPGMLQSGVSRQLFDRWASDAKNGVMIAGYAVEHTLAKEIMAQPKEVVTLEGRRQPLNCLVDYVSFSAHVDFVQNRSFITQVAPKHIILVHGQKDEMGRLKSALMLQYRTLPESKRPTITMPPNLQDVKLKFARRRSAKAMGSLANNNNDASTTGNDDEGKTRYNTTTTSNEPVEGQAVRGILVTHNFHSKLVAPQDVATYTPLRLGSIASKLHVPFAGSVETLRIFFYEMFAGVTEKLELEEQSTQDEEEGNNNDDEADTTTGTRPSTVVVFSFRGLVKVAVSARQASSAATSTSKSSSSNNRISPCTAIVEWEANPQGDVLADAIVALILQAQSCAASIRLTSKPCRHPRDIDDEGSIPRPSAIDDNDFATSPSPSSSLRKKVKVEEGSTEPTTATIVKTEEGGVTAATTTSRLRFLHATLKEQFQNVEAVYGGGRSATYEIQTDTGLDSSSTALDDDGILRCSVRVDFDDDVGGNAQISVESKDEKLAKNVHECIRNAAAVTQPINL
jgi:Pre-mRNA 3'-end-processing endonuclease polyadenylation factor C-term/Beta-Casp domain/Zn-dependent metallo-hydrolase RNA specificity domain